MKNRKVYIVMGYAFDTKSTYISEVCSTKKKAEQHKEWMEEVMEKHGDGVLRAYWVYDSRVA